MKALLKYEDTVSWVGVNGGCRFITVDAYNDESTISFYTKNGIEFLTDKDENDETRLMYFDLKDFLNIE